MRIIKLPVDLKDKANRYVEYKLDCEILSRGATWILVNDPVGN